MTVIATLKDGRILSYEDKTEVVTTGNNNLTITFPDLKYVEYVLQVQFKTNPDVELQSGPGQDKHIEGNVVGMTLKSVGAGTTLTQEVIVIGPP